MRNDKGLCQTCIEAKGCILMNSLPVWFCEEFSVGNEVHPKAKPLKSERLVVCTEEE